MRRIKSGFTIVEILITVAIIGILSTIGLVSFARYQQDARDAQRSSKATILAEALEKYYDKNGEYPSCPDMTGSSSAVVTEVLPGIEKSTLVAPGSPSDDNSIKCEDLTTNATNDFFAYVGGDTSPECLSGSACLLYTIQYKEESTGTIRTIESRRQTTVAGIPVLTCPTNTFSQISCEWTSIAGASSYELQRATNSTFTNNLQTSSIAGLTNSSTDLGYCTQYYFRVRTVSASGSGPWSTTVSKTTSCLSTPTCSATANSFTQITASWGAITNASSYTLEYDDNSDFSSLTGTYTGTALSSARTGLSYGTTYYFRVKASVTEGNSPWSSTCQVATQSLSTPTLTTVTNSVSQITASWSTISNATSYTVHGSTSSSFTSPTSYTTASLSQVFTGLMPGTTYYFRVQAVNGSYTSSWSATSTRATSSPVLAGQATCAGTYSARSAFQVRLTIQEVSYDIPSNTSNINWSLYRYAQTAGWATWDQTAQWPWSISIDGQGSSGTSWSGFWKNNASVVGETEGISSGTKTITHNADGTKTIGYSGSDGPGGIFGSASCSGGSYVLSDLR